jgi:phosphoribosylanthranilate isomerase
MSGTQIKICGLKTREAIEAAAVAGATHVGLNLYAPSPRSVSVDEAANLRRVVPESVKTVLLLVDLDSEAATKAITAVKPDIVQFHGKESPEQCAAIRNALGIPVWKAVGVKDPSSLEDAQRYIGAVDMILYDAPPGELPGGQGIKLDWSLLSGYRHKVPWGLAGGLNASNVAESIRQTGAPLVDTSSGVESAPGVKDIDKIRTFCQAARGAREKT